MAFAETRDLRFGGPDAPANGAGPHGTDARPQPRTPPRRRTRSGSERKGAAAPPPPRSSTAWRPWCAGRACRGSHAAERFGGRDAAGGRPRRTPSDAARPRRCRLWAASGSGGAVAPGAGASPRSAAATRARAPGFAPEPVKAAAPPPPGRPRDSTEGESSQPAPFHGSAARTRRVQPGRPPSRWLVEAARASRPTPENPRRPPNPTRRRLTPAPGSSPTV
jgi:hypothetical protein